ncbi:coiled-coil domain-containing 60-like, partial [Brachionus plicatilis]
LSSKKQNDKVFFKVLKSLRIWELISPDVMSAVEFCRDKILEIQVDEFEKWFKSTHPDYFVSRQNPASAPPTLDYE